MSDLSIAAGVVLRDAEGAVLLLRRPTGEWGIAGGKGEAGETAVQAAIREVAEETGLVLQPEQLRPLRESPSDNGYQFTCFGARVPRFTPIMGDGEHDAWQWCAPGYLPPTLFMDTAALVALDYAGMGADKSEIDNNGWTTYPDNPISMEGVFPYLGRSIGVEGLEPDQLYNVYRPGDELAKAVDSFKLVPWIAGHTHMGEGSEDAGDVGIGGIVGEQVYYKDGVLYGNLKVFTGAQKALIAGGVKELSLGYTAEFEYSPGTWAGQAYDFVQRNIQGNHLASVDEGRCGPAVSVRDGFIFDAKEYAMDEETKKAIEAMQAQLRELAETVAKLTNSKTEGDEDPADPATTPAAVKKDGDEDPADPATPVKKDGDEDPADPAAGGGAMAPAATVTIEAVTADAMPKFFAAVARRDKLAAALVPHVGVFDHSVMTEAQVAEYGAKKLNVPAAELSGYLRGVAAASARKLEVAAIGDAADTSELPAFLRDHVA